MLGAGWGKLPVISRFYSRTGDWLRRSRLNDGSRMSGDVHVRLCVQRRLACSAGGKPAGVRISSPVAWIAGRRETKVLKPIDRVFLGEIASHRAVTKVNAEVAPKMSSLEGRAHNRRVKAAWTAECWLRRLYHFGGVVATAR